MKFIIKRQSIYLLLYIFPAYSYILYNSFPFSHSPFLSELRVSATPLLWLQSDLWYSPIAIFKIALKIKKTPAVLSGRALSWKNLQLGLLAIPLYHISYPIARKIPLAEARGIFPEKGYDGKPSECLSLFAVLMLHSDGVFTAFVAHSGIVFASLAIKHRIMMITTATAWMQFASMCTSKFKLSPHAGLAPDYSPLLRNEPPLPTSTLSAPPA